MKNVKNFNIFINEQKFFNEFELLNEGIVQTIGWKLNAKKMFYKKAIVLHTELYNLDLKYKAEDTKEKKLKLANQIKDKYEELGGLREAKDKYEKKYQDQWKKELAKLTPEEKSKYDEDVKNGMEYIEKLKTDLEKIKDKRDKIKK